MKNRYKFSSHFTKHFLLNTAGSDKSVYNDQQYSTQKNKDWTTQITTIKRGWTRVLAKDTQFLSHKQVALRLKTRR